MEPIIIDSNVIVASFLEREDFHQKGKQYIDGLEAGDYIFHLSMLAAVEVTAAISRQAKKNRQALMVAWKQNLRDWQQDGKLILYELDRDRMDDSMRVAETYRLRGSDAVMAALAEGLDMPFKTFDVEVLEQFVKASK